MSMAGRITVVTGAGRGIGEAVARRLAAEGSKVAVADLDLTAANTVATSIGEAALAVELDVRSWASVEAGAALVEATLGPVDALVNNAGISRVARAEDLRRDWWDDVVDVNLNGTWRCAQTFGRLMVTRGRGAIVNIGSAYSEIGAPGRVAYTATKTAIVGIPGCSGSNRRAVESAVNAVEPGYIDTPMMQVTLETGSSTPQRWSTGSRLVVSATPTMWPNHRLLAVRRRELHYPRDTAHRWRPPGVRRHPVRLIVACPHGAWR